MNLDPTQVAEYLRNHPDFFETNITLLTDVEIPHPHGGRAISIGERQVLALREKNRLIEAKLGELIQFGKDNDAISEKIQRFACALLGSHNLDEVLQTVATQLRDSFMVPHALVRLWDSALPGAENLATSTEIRDFVAAMKAPYCGHHPVYETNRWFGDAAPHLKSFAMVRLGGAMPIGMVLLASEDAERFYPEMGTLYLTRIGELVTAALQRYVVA